MKAERCSLLRTIGEKPSERPLPPKQMSSAVPWRVAASRACAKSSARGMRSSAARSPPGPTSSEKRMRCVVNCRHAQV